MAPTVLELLRQAHEKQKDAIPSQKRFKITSAISPSSSQTSSQLSSKCSLAGPSYQKPKTRVISLKRSAKLHMLPSLPLDILFEIFSHLLPSDLLQLSRTSKDLRNLLLQKSATTIWKASFKKVVDIQCPTDVSYPGWASLMYDKECHVCFAPNTRTFNYILRIRLCGKCVKKHLSEDWQEKGDTRKLIQECIPCVLWGRTSRNVCLTKTKTTFLEDLKKHTQESEDARTAFIKQMKENLKARAQNAELWHKWSEGLYDDRQRELDDMRSERSDALKEKLRAAGYEAELIRLEQRSPVPYLSSPFPDWDQHSSVKQPKPLTERNWVQIKENMISYMDQVRAVRLREERHSLVWSRRELLTAQWQIIRKGMEVLGEFIPNPIDIWFWQPISNIVDRPSTIVVDTSSFDVALRGLPFFVKRWKEEREQELVRLLPFCLSPSAWVYPHREHLLYAVCVLSCTKVNFHASFNDWPEDQYPCMWFPEFVHHPCNTLDHQGYWFDDNEKDVDPTEQELRLAPCLRTDMEFRGFRRRKWSTKWLTFDHKASKTVQNILDACSMPMSTLTEELDKADPRLVCLKCSFGAKCDGERRFPILTWRGAVQHTFKKHWGDGGVAWQKISDEDATLARALEDKEPARRGVQIEPGKPWRCGHCKDTPKDPGPKTFSRLQVHLDAVHGGSTGMQEGVDYYKGLDRPPREPLVVQMIPRDPNRGKSDANE